MKFKLLTVAPKQGLSWVREGLNEWRQRPMAYTGLLMAFMLALMLCALVPVIGGGLILLAVPLLSLAFMMATRASLNGHRPGPGVFVAPWAVAGPHRQRLLLLCFWYAVLSAGVMWLGQLVDDGALEALMDGINDPKTTEAQVQQLIQAPALVPGVMLRLGLTLLIGMPFWHAPALVMWADQGVAQAMFSSTVALWRTRWAFVMYGLGWSGVALLASLGMNLLLALVGGSGLGSFVVIGLGLTLTSAYYVSLFFSFSQSFSVEA